MVRRLILKYVFLVIVVISVCISIGKCQDDDEEDEDTYDEELTEVEVTTPKPTTIKPTTPKPTTTITRRYRIRSTSTASPVTPVGTASIADDTSNIPNKPSDAATLSAVASSVTEGAVVSAVVAPAPVVNQAPATAAPVTVPTTTASEYDDDEDTTEEEGYGYIFRPLNNLVDNIVAGNVTGIVDNALSIRTPPEIRRFVNTVMGNVFGSGIGSAIKQFMPKLFSTKATPTEPIRDPIPMDKPKRKTSSSSQMEMKNTIVVEARTNSTDENGATEPIQFNLTGHPGAPASRLSCTIIA